MTVEATDALSAGVVKNPNTRVSLADIEAQIAHTFTTTLGRALKDCVVLSAKIEDETVDAATKTVRDNMRLLRSVDHMTLCVLVLKNGYIVIGKSAPMDPENFNAELGAKLARDDAIRQIWPLMAFARLS